MQSKLLHQLNELERPTQLLHLLNEFECSIQHAKKRLPDTTRQLHSSLMLVVGWTNSRAYGPSGQFQLASDGTRRASVTCFLRSLQNMRRLTHRSAKEVSRIEWHSTEQKISSFSLQDETHQTVDALESMWPISASGTAHRANSVVHVLKSSNLLRVCILLDVSWLIPSNN